MKIEVAAKISDSKKVKGDLLENLTEKLLQAQQYEVEKELRNTGAEIDLLCKHKVSQKIIYVECKAYRDKKIDAPTLYKMMGIRSSKEYDEAWLITTSLLGKDAKGVVENEKSKGVTELSFYTPDKIVEALIGCGSIEDKSISEKKFIELASSKNKLGASILLVTEYGLFWCFEHLSGGVPVGVLAAYANNSEIVEDEKLLESLQETDTSLNELNFKNIASLGDKTVDMFGRYIFDEKYNKLILDTGIKLTHSNKANIDIDDVFVYQDIQEVDGDKTISSSKLKGLKGEFSKVVVFGDDVSGKTTLAHRLQRKNLDLGYIPVYIDAVSIKSSEPQKFKKLVTRNLKKQYKNVSDEVLNTIDNDRIILIIDNYHKIALNRENKLLLNSNLEEEYPKVLIFCNTSQKLEMVTDNDFLDSFPSFNLFQIQEYGYTLRDKVISQWISIGQKETINDKEKHRRVLEISETINTTVGQRFVPTFPIYILTLLQSFEASSTKSLQGSAYAEFYNYLITHALGSSGVTPDELHVYISYLSNLANLFFVKEVSEIDENEFKDFHKIHCARKLIARSFEFNKLKETLIRSKIMNENDGVFKFNHSYIYYFFTARYLSEHITENEIQEKVTKIAEKLHYSEYANIILFLIHFSKTKFIFEKIISEAKDIFSDIESITFKESEFKNINKLIEKEVKVIFKEKTPEQARLDQLEYADEISNNHSQDITQYDGKDDDLSALDIFSKINLSFRIMEILGQISKNYYGSLDGDVKIEIVGEVYNLGLRSLNKIMLNFEKYSDLLVEQISEKVEEQKVTSDADVTTITKKIVFDFATMISMGFISKTANSIASKDLYEVIDILSKENQTIAKELINVAIRLDFPRGLNINSIIKISGKLKDNNIATMILRLFVIKHLYKFHVDYDKKQTLYKILNISPEKQKKLLTVQK